MKKALIFIAFLAFTDAVISQNTKVNTYNSILPGDELHATPDVAAFQKYNALPVNLYTGRIDINLPLYEVNIGNIQIPISISYNTSGVKVDDVASNIGLGWNLNAGGNIVKITKDLDDHEYKIGMISEEDFDPAYLTCTFVRSKGYFKDYVEDTQGSFTSCQDFDFYAEEDAAPDEFIASAPGLFSRFILEKNTNTFDILPLDGSGVKNTDPINFSYSNYNSPLGFELDEIGYSANGNNGEVLHNIWTNPNVVGAFKGYVDFEIANTNGLIYTFDKKDLRESLNRAPRYTLGNYNDYYNQYITAYHLSKIVDPSSNREVNFLYNEYQKTTIQFERSVTEDALEHLTGTNPYGGNFIFAHIPRFNEYYNNELNEFDESVFKASMNFVKYPVANRLSQIQFDTGTIDFIYGLVRQDTYDEEALTKIEVKDSNGTLITTFEFDYSYFISKESCAQPECKRLKLEGVRKVDGNNASINLYTFDYEYSNPLPKVNSLQQDFLGYYNNNGVTTPPNDPANLQTKQPTLYYYENQGKNSILPFPLTGQSLTTTIPGDFSLTPNDYSLSGVLTSIEKATGGKIEFEYETHRFNFLGNEYTSGGARISRQRLTDENNDVRVFDYEYTFDDGSSSGFINNLPTYGYPYVWNPNTNNVAFAVFDKPRSTIELTDGSFVGYSQVIKREVGNGHTKYLFTSPQQHPNVDETFISGERATGATTPLITNAINFLKNNSSYPNSHYIDNDILRGRLIKEDVFKQNSELLLRTEFEYTKNVFNTVNLNYRDALSNDLTDGQDRTVGLWLFYHSSQLNIERNLQTKKTTTEYLEGSQKITEEFYEYDATYPFLTKQRVIDATDEISTEYYYPFQPQVSSQPYISTLVNQNRISSAVIQVSKRDNIQISKSQVNYNNFNGSVLPKSASSAKTAMDPLIEEGEIITRDEYGNVEEFISKDGVSTYILWGYNKTLPIAIVKGATKTQVAHWYYNDTNEDLFDIQNASDADDSLANEAILKSQLDNLRNALGGRALITTYTYDPLIGAKSMTDERGNTVYYEYDSYNRLKYVKDVDGNIVNENTYNYKS